MYICGLGIIIVPMVLLNFGGVLAIDGIQEIAGSMSRISVGLVNHPVNYNCRRLFLRNRCLIKAATQAEIALISDWAN